MTRFALFLAAVFCFFSSPAHAANIGLPGESWALGQVETVSIRLSADGKRLHWYISGSGGRGGGLVNYQIPTRPLVISGSVSLERAPGFETTLRDCLTVLDAFGIERRANITARRVAYITLSGGTWVVDPRDPTRQILQVENTSLTACSAHNV
jgi:hypothetical protein